jgi:uncharacterized protein YjbI with pentapeptide repeats
MPSFDQLFKLQAGAEMWNEWRATNRERPDLTQAALGYANLSGANLANANLTGADLHRANLTDANLSRAVLNLVDLKGANLTRANMSSANLTGAMYDVQTVFPAGFNPLAAGMFEV